MWKRASPFPPLHFLFKTFNLKLARLLIRLSFVLNSNLLGSATQHDSFWSHSGFLGTAVCLNECLTYDRVFCVASPGSFDSGHLGRQADLLILGQKMACTEARQLSPFRRRGGRWGRQIPCRFSPFLSRDCQSGWITQGSFISFSMMNNCAPGTAGPGSGDHISGIWGCSSEATLMSVKCVQGIRRLPREMMIMWLWGGRRLLESWLGRYVWVRYS